MLVIGTHEQSHSNVNEKNILEVPLFSPLLVPPPFTAYLLYLNYEKSAKCNPTFRQDKFFSILPKYWQVSKYTGVKQIYFSKRGKRIKSKFLMVNLCNGGTKDFVELWGIIHLKIWTHFSIRQKNLFWVNLKHYSQTSSSNHLCKTTTSLRRPMLSVESA